MDLKLKDKDVLIENVVFPKPYQISLEKRGKTAVNHRYVEESKELQIYCFNCNRWHPTYRLVDGAWVDINKTYRLCNKGKEREYFDTYCLKCYQIHRGKEKPKEIEHELIVNEDKKEKEDVGKERIQQTVFLYPENDMYIKLYCVFHNKKKNQLINEIIAEFKAKNPINL